MRLYFRRKGEPKVRIHEALGSTEFPIRYRQLCNAICPSRRGAPHQVKNDNRDLALDVPAVFRVLAIVRSIP